MANSLFMPNDLDKNLLAIKRDHIDKLFDCRYIEFLIECVADVLVVTGSRRKAYI
jgi:hypothetical protein